MYQMKTIVPTEKKITLPQCMYFLKNPNDNLKIDEAEINISDQVMRFLKGAPKTTMIELEKRQSQLLLKLDVLYDRVKSISTLCKCDVQPSIDTPPLEPIPSPKEIVIILNPDIMPSCLHIFLKENPELSVTWHIHSSVPNDKGYKIKDFFKNNPELCSANSKTKTNLRLIFKCVSASMELMMSSLEVPLLGIVNTLRYLCLLYPNVIPYDQSDYYVDGLLDQCHLLEKAPGNNKEEIVNKIFAQSKTWVYQNELSVVDLAAFIVIKLQKLTKSVPKSWYNKCENTFL